MIGGFLFGCAIGLIVWVPLLIWIRIENGPFKRNGRYG